MPIHLHRGLRADTLADELASQLSSAPADPMVPDVVAVPTRGVERFLAQRMALHLGASAGAADGVCANVLFPSPQELLAGALGTADRDSAWLRPQLTWAVAAQLPGLIQLPQFSAVAHHLAGPPGFPQPGRLFDTAARIAALLERYDQERPSLLAEWAEASGLAGVAPQHQWQVLLVRSLTKVHGAAPAQRLAGDCAELRADPARAALPQRLSLFGPTRISGRALAIIEAIAAHREVHIWLVDPAPTAWSPQPQAPAGKLRSNWPPATHNGRGAAGGNPLLASLGRDFAELGQRLQPLATGDTVHGAPGPEATGLLGRLQSDIAANRRPQPLEHSPAGSDSSLMFHSCYGSQRQVEVIREVVLGLLAADPTLQPRDILVMTPDLEVFGPLFTATFDHPAGQSSPNPIASLRARVADRTPEQGNHVLTALLATVELLHARITIGELLDYAALPAVARRFAFTEEDLTRAGELAQSAGVRWGLGKATRSRYQMGWATSGTWAFGLDRMLLGVALSEAELVSFGQSLPLDDVASTDVDLLGRLHDLVVLLTAAEAFQKDGHTLAQWTDWLQALLLDLTATTASDAWMTTNALAAVNAPVRAAGATHAHEVSLQAADIRSILRATVASRPTRSNFRTGGLTLSGMAPMRSVPHRVIILAGMDDGAFPRSGDPDGDDIIAAEPHIGERDARLEERQLLLDAVMAAQEHLIITFSGHDERTNEPRPPCVPIGELIDVVKVMLGSAIPPGNILVEHPLQPFDPRNFRPGALVADAAFSHNRTDLAGAMAMRGVRSQPPAFLEHPLPPSAPSELALSELAAVLQDPVAGFLRYRLNLPTSGEEEPPDERLAVELSGLANWKVGDRLLGAVLRGVPAQRLTAMEPMRGTLPPGELGTQAMLRLGHEVQGLAESVQAWLCPPVTSVRVTLPIGGVLLHGAVVDCVRPPDFADADSLIVRSSFSRFKPSSQVRLWVHLLAAAVARPEQRWGAILQVRDRAVGMLAPESAVAAGHLTDLLALYSSAMREPLPLPPRSAYHYALARSRRASREDAMAAAHKRGWEKYGDHSAATVQLVWRSPKDLSEICQEPGPGEEYPQESERFAILARRLWDPILRAEKHARAWVGTL